MRKRYVIFVLLLVFCLSSIFSVSVDYYKRKYGPVDSFEQKEGAFGPYYNMTVDLDGTPMEVSLLKNMGDNLILVTIDDVSFIGVDDSAALALFLFGTSDQVDNDWHTFANQIKSLKSNSIYKQYLSNYELKQISHDLLLDDRYYLDLKDSGGERHQLTFTYKNHDWEIYNSRYESINQFMPLTPLKPKIVFRDDLIDPNYVLTVSIRGYGELTDEVVLEKVLYQFASPEYSLIITHAGDEFRNMDGILKIRADEEILVFNSTAKKNINKNNEFQEVLTYNLDESDFMKLLTCSNLRIQYWEDPITISRDGVNALNYFSNHYQNMNFEEL